MAVHGIFGLLLGIFLVTSFLSYENIFADSDEKEIKFKEKIEKIKKEAKKTPKDKKIDREQFEKEDSNSKKISKILTKSIKNKNDRQEFGVSSLDDQEKIIVYIHLDNKESLSEIPSKYEIISYSDNIVVARLSLDEMNEMSDIGSVKKIGPLQKAVFYNHQTSEGVAASAINNFHAVGFDGTGINVAIIDAGFVITDPEISSNIVSSQLFDSGGWCAGDINCRYAAGDSHGTAVAEIIVDMAPDVNLMLYAIGNSVDFANAVDNAMANGADIITASLGFPTAGGDGTTGYFRDGTSIVAKKVNDANAADLLFTVAAGNEGASHWKGNYVPSPVTPTSLGLGATNQNVMDFQPGATGKQRACLPVYDYGDLYITSWNDWDWSFNDYDLYLFDSTMTNVLAFGFDDQTIGGEPIEYFYGANAGPACLVLASWSSSQNHFFHIDAENNYVYPSVLVRSGSIGTPADATGSFSIGAVDVNTMTLESFSSSGPTDDGRAKPEICGYDGTFSHQSALNPFYGTSSAAPHVAGAAAVLLEKDPTLTNTQLKNELTGMASFDPAFSSANLCGLNSGALLLDFSLTPPPQTDVVIPFGTSSPGCETTPQGCLLPSSLTIDQGDTVNWFNGDNAIHTVTSGTAADGPAGFFDSGIIYPNTSFSHTFTQSGTFPYYDMVHLWIDGEIIVNSIGTCGLSFPDGSSVDYGTLSPDQLSSEITLNMTNTGNITALLEVRGTDWKDVPSNVIMNVNRTHYSMEPGLPYSSNVSLESFDKTVTASFLPSTLLQTFWQLEAILNQVFSGNVSQTMDFTVSC